MHYRGYLGPSAAIEWVVPRPVSCVGFAEVASILKEISTFGFKFKKLCGDKVGEANFFKS